MKVTKSDNSATNVTIKVNGDATDLAPIKRHVISHFTDSVKVPGFRAGKAPLELVEKNVNQQLLIDEFMEHALNDLFRKAVDEQKLKPVGQPDVKLKKFVPYTELEFEATLDVLGPLTLPNYKTIKQTKPKVDVTAKDVNDVLDSLKKRVADRVEVARPAKEGDELIIDFAGKDDKGTAVAGADGKDFPLTLGSSTFIPGFEENLIGMKPGDKKDFTIKFPKDYGVGALQNKDVTFSVEVKTVSELAETKLDDAFAMKVGPFDSLKDLKEDIKKQVRSEKQAQADQQYENQLIKTITDKTKMEIPEVLIEDQLNRMEAQEKQNLVYRGTTWQEHLDQEGITEEQHRERHRPEAEERVKAGLALSEVSLKEGIDVTPEEIDLRIQILKGQYQDPTMMAELDSPANRQDIAARLLTEKTIAKLVGYASKL
ncbi:MAG: Trigger factor [Candidatus Saccharibacteria bacterium]|nr:Trigger factor [Candidatus Saccharibacteria bacterium]